jgi:AraC-like DNA-binding protein
LRGSGKPAPALVAVDRFTTSDFAPRDRHEAWAQRDWPAIGPAYETVPTGQFHNCSERYGLGAVGVHLSDMGGQTYRRTPANRRRDGFDQLCVSLLLTGAAHGDANGRSIAIGAAELTLIDMAQDEAHVSTGARSFLLMIPRELAERSGIDVRTNHGARVARGAAMPLRRHLISTHRGLATLSREVAAQRGELALDLLMLALGTVTDMGQASSRARDIATRARAEEFVERYIQSPELNPALIARAAGTSRARLYRLFEEEGGVHAFLRERRLERIRLELDSLAAEPIAELGYRFGFEDHAHLSRLFRLRYGLTPSDYRQRTALTRAENETDILTAGARRS